jgi:putative PIN family toxin of toxin-antitoxin system
VNQRDSTRPIVVGDTNFWVSAIIGSGLCYKLSQLIFEGKIHHVTSLKLLRELTDVLRRHFGYSDVAAYSWYKNIGAISTVVYPAFSVLEQIQASRNHADNPLLECAVFASADYLVTRDKDLQIFAS